MKIPGAWLAAALFGLHPVHVESVAWIHERKDVLSAFWCYLNFAGLVRRRMGRGAFVCMVFYGLALGPILGLIDFSFMDIAWVADRYQYLASIGPLVLIAAELSRVQGRWGDRFGEAVDKNDQ